MQSGLTLNGQIQKKSDAGSKKLVSRYCGKLIVEIEVYADETGTHGLKKGGKEPAPGVYGFIASVEYWEIFRIEWSKTLIKYNAPYFHFRELHPSERARRRNPYHGWDNNRVDDFIYDLAIVASREAVPFGGYVSVRMLKKERVNPQPYRTAFEMFFEDFTTQMNLHWPNFKNKVSFYFDDNQNDNWIAVLNQVIRSKQRKDSRIGEAAFVKSKDNRGIPCQAADLFAYVNRQNTETIFEQQQYQPSRILDLILSRNAFPKTHPSRRFSTLTETQWENLIKAFREDKKTMDISNVVLGNPKQPYHPFSHLNRIFRKYGI
jgi:hypothetical protein